MFFRLDLSNNALNTLNDLIFRLPTRLHISGNSFKCSCIYLLFKKFRKHIVDENLAECISKSRKQLIKNFGHNESLLENIDCINEKPLAPFGNELYVDIGEFYSLYCVAVNGLNPIIWTLPNGTRIYVNESQVK